MKPGALSSAIQEIAVVSCADENYAMPLAVTIRSMLDRLRRDCRVRLFILDGGIAPTSQERLVDSWKDSRLSVEFLRPDVDLVRDLPVSDHISVAAYLRLLMPSLLPADVSRVIYLDADMLVRRDLADLWAEEQGGFAALAVQDQAAPYFNAETSIPGFDDKKKHLAAFTPIANYRELGLSPANKYFNSGLMVIDVAQWRRDRIGDQVLNCLREHREHVQWWDQYALNIVLAERWRALDLQWNQGVHVYICRNWTESWLDQTTFSQLRKAPWIVHFCSPAKPWHYFCRHPFAGEFRRSLRQTAWRDWRPTPPERLLSKWWDFYYRPVRNEWKTQVRALKKAVRGDKRKAA